MIEFKEIPGSGYSKYKDRDYIYNLASGSYILKRQIIKGNYTAWADNRYVKTIYNFQLNKEEYDKVHDTLGIGEWSFGIYFQSGYSIRVEDIKWFNRIIEILGL